MQLAEKTIAEKIMKIVRTSAEREIDDCSSHFNINRFLN